MSGTHKHRKCLKRAKKGLKSNVLYLSGPHATNQAGTGGTEQDRAKKAGTANTIFRARIFLLMILHIWVPGFLVDDFTYLGLGFSC